MNETIRKRKSIRKFELTTLSDETMGKVREQIATLTPLYPDIRYSVEIASKTIGMFGIKAPHYLVFYSENKEGTLENIGFIGQQMDLLLAESGLGTCWLGVAKPEEKERDGMPCIITMAFGKPAEPLYRNNTSEFKRKPLSEISEGTDERLEAARLAPSGMNLQNWHFIADSGKIHCYRKKARLGFMDKMACVDMGIAIYHIAAETDNFGFTKEENPPARKGHIYMGTIV